MKTKKLSLALMSLVLGFASCSEEIDVIETNNDKDYESTTFASLTINLSTDTKAVPGEFGDGTVAAEEGEQLISELYLFSFKNEEGDESLLFSKRFGSIIVSSAQLTGETGPFAIPVVSQ